MFIHVSSERLDAAIPARVVNGNPDHGFGTMTTEIDAVRCMAVGFLPIFPTAVVHVVHPDGINREREIPLRFSVRLIAKAFFWSWGIGLPVLGVVIAAVAMAIALVSPPDEAHGIYIHGVAVWLAIACIGVALRRWAWAMEEADRRRRTLFSDPVFGCADPLVWPRDQAAACAMRLMDETATDTLIEAADRLIATGQHHRAATAARFAQTDRKQRFHADEQMRILARWWEQHPPSTDNGGDRSQD